MLKKVVKNRFSQLHRRKAVINCNTMCLLDCDTVIHVTPSLQHCVGEKFCTSLTTNSTQEFLTSNQLNMDVLY